MINYAPYSLGMHNGMLNIRPIYVFCPRERNPGTYTICSSSLSDSCLMALILLKLFPPSSSLLKWRIKDDKYLHLTYQGCSFGVVVTLFGGFFNPRVCRQNYRHKQIQLNYQTKWKTEGKKSERKKERKKKSLLVNLFMSVERRGAARCGATLWSRRRGVGAKALWSGLLNDRLDVWGWSANDAAPVRLTWLLRAPMILASVPSPSLVIKNVL